MIELFNETDFELTDSLIWIQWIESCMSQENLEIGELNYVFCDDEYLLDINIKYLQHDYYTDVIGFDYSKNNILSGDIFISVDRVKENAIENMVPFQNELARIMIHGILHFAGYKDSEANEKTKMTDKENRYLEQFKALS